jgi:glycosyltransferase involved in cell wall biosynthesis
MPDVVEHEFNGLLILPADSAAIEQAILRLAGSEELQRNLGEAARESMRRQTWERAGRQLEALFLRVLANNTRDKRDDQFT